MKNYPNLVEAIQGLRKEGYTEDFSLQPSCIACQDKKFEILHDEFEVDQYFRFDVNTDPDDQSIIYAISSKKYGVKGILINAYGIYSEPITNIVLEKLKMHGK